MSSDGKVTPDSGLCLNYGTSDSRAHDGSSVEADVDTEDVSTLNDEGPSTPDEADQITTPPPFISSPSIPSPMSWGKLDLITPLGQHLAASLARSPERSPPVSLGGEEPGSRTGSDTPQLDLDVQNDSPAHSASPPGQDARDALVLRLTELAQRISQGDSLNDQATLDALNSGLDDLDHVAAGGHKALRLQQRSRLMALETETQGAHRQDSAWSSPSSSWMRSRYSDLSASARRDVPPPEPQVAVRKPAVDSFKLASEAEKLNAELETLMSNLKARQEESEHIHALLVTRAERAAQRIIFLQSRVGLLESELHESDADLSHLRLGLKAIEVQCPREILGRDTELSRSIANWKRDYADLKQRREARRRRILAEEASHHEEDDAGSVVSADTSAFTETTDDDTFSMMSTPSRPPRQSQFGTENSGLAFETPSPVTRGGRPHGNAAMSKFSTRRDPPRDVVLSRGDAHEAEETLTPTSVRSRSTAMRDDPHMMAFETARPSTNTSRALRRIVMSATPPRRRLDSLGVVPPVAFGPPLQRSNSARTATSQYRHHHHEPSR
ncbi:hypothetical protein F5X68DRAFT_80849 [Plectosphaerella plurivora]|uniref:Uncharacterized protein n=1 Tax=Plectosphaerella plurivora TaxID=936078 RepID=A0A9P8VEI6_9PEZI|nr:hypothetical protein F5X68DRAFT_80849 [Plectosphaerella plurivora]